VLIKDNLIVTRNGWSLVQHVHRLLQLD